MTTKEMIAVMQAYDEGKQIQQRLINNSTWADCPSPKWKWDASEYRIKPELPKPKLRPYANAEEFIEAQQEHGLYFGKDKKIYHIQNSVYDNYGKTYVTGSGFDMTTESLFKEGYTWLDGTPCGIIEEE